MRILIISILCSIWVVCGYTVCNISQEMTDKDLSHCSSVVFHEVFNYNLSELIDIRNRNKFNITGDDSVTTIQCFGNAGVLFNNTHDIVLENIEFKECGFHHYRNDTDFNAAVLIINCTNISIRNLLFTKSNGVGLVLLDSSGHVEIFDSSFNLGKVLELTRNTTGGGGGINIQQITTNESTYVRFIIQNTNFTNNLADTHCPPNACNSFCSFGYGGGVAISLLEYSPPSNITIKNCNFINNSAIAGGGVEIMLCNPRKTNLSFENVYFIGNKVYLEGGGGIDMVWSDHYNSSSECIINNVVFVENYARYGGGAAIAFTSIKDTSYYIHFSNCEWSNNKALYGSALDILQKEITEKHYNHKVFIKNCTFRNNSNCHLPTENNFLQMGSGVIMATGLKIDFHGDAVFSNNSGPAIFAVETEILFKDATVYFNRNAAEYGSCITLTGLSTIVLKSNSTLNFCNNWAEENSSMVFYLGLDKNRYSKSRRYSFENIISQTTNNSVYHSGNMLPSDRKYIDRSIENDTSFKFFLGKAKVFDSDKCGPNISLKPIPPSSTQICYHLRNVTYEEPDPVLYIPGIKKVITNFSSSLYSFRVTLFTNGSKTVGIPKIYEYITNELMLQGMPGSEVTIYLHDRGLQDLHYIFKGILVHCPPQYELSEDYKCKCYKEDATYYKLFFKCPNGNLSYSSIFSGYWIGYYNSSGHINENIIVGLCPIGFCNVYKQLIEVPYNDRRNQTDLDKVLCLDRQDILCGRCANGKVVYLHTSRYKCGVTDKCHVGILYFLLAEIAPITAVFLTLIFFNIKLTAGGISGFIFFAQMYELVHIKEEITKNSISHKYLFFHHIIYQLFNFEFVEIDALSFCLVKGLRTVDILAVKYAVSAYALLLILVTIFTIKYCRRFKFSLSRSRKYSIVQVISTFMVIVYSKCAFISFSLLRYQNLYQGLTPVRKVLSLQGDMEFLDIDHLPFAIAAVLVLTFFIIPLPLLLTFYPMVNKWVSKLNLDNVFVVKVASRILPLYKLLPFFDTFQGIFKEKYRFFSGLYFIYRLLVLSSLFFPYVSIIYVIVTLQLIIILLIHILTWPYKQKLHNVIDALLLVNLAIISGLKLMRTILAIYDYTSIIIKTVEGVEIIFVNIPIVVFIIYCSKNCFKILANFFRKPPDNPTELFLSDNIREIGSDHYHPVNSLFKDNN